MFFLPIFVSLCLQISQIGAETETEFDLPVSGVINANSIYSQFGITFPSRPKRGMLTAGMVYYPVGSAPGIQMVRDDKAVACCSQNVIPDDIVSANLTALPLMIAGSVVVYNPNNFPNFDESRKIVFPYDFPVKVFLGEITNWNCTELITANPGVNFPNMPIHVIVNNETTAGSSIAIRNLFAKTHNSWTATRPSDPWPVAYEAEENEMAVVAKILLTPGSIGIAGYELAISTNTPFGKFKNPAGREVLPYRNNLLEALNWHYNRNQSAMNHLADKYWWGGDITLAQSSNAYPLAFFHYGIMKRQVYETPGSALNCRQRREINRYVYWRLTTKTAQDIMFNAGYCPIPDWLAAIVTEQAKTITCNGQSLYGASPCDNGCDGGTCNVDGKWNPPEDICQCDILHINTAEKKDCSVLSPLATTEQAGPPKQPGTEFVVEINGAPESNSLYSQFAYAYPNRLNRGKLTAGLYYGGGGTWYGIQRMLAGNILATCSLNTIPPDMSQLMAAPQMVGSVVIIYNKQSFPSMLVGQKLVFPYDLVVKIYAGNITKWNDPYIKQYNPNITLPNADIIVVTTKEIDGGKAEAMRKAFTKVDPNWAKNDNNDPWPKSDIMVQDEVTIAAAVITNLYAIGFCGLETAIASGIPYAQIENSNGDTVEPTYETMYAAFEYYYNIPGYFDNRNNNYIGGEITNAPAPNAYPYVFFFYVMSYKNPILNPEKCRQRREILRFVDWRINSDQGPQIMRNAGFMPLPKYFVNEVMKFVIDNSYCNGTKMFGASPCDVGCVGGKCSVKGQFNPPEDVCECDVFHINKNFNNCSELAPPKKFQQVDAPQAVKDAAYFMSFAGATQTASLYSQMAIAYPDRPKMGTVKAGITYQAVGSSAGLQKVENNEVQIACSLNTIPTNTSYLTAVPQAVGALVVVYHRTSFPNLPEGAKMTFPYDLVLKIYQGKVTMWDDPLIADANPGLALPREKIVVVACSDTGGGASSAMRQVFAGMDPTWNATQPGDPWPVADILAADEISTISQVILTPFSIGFAGYEQAISTNTEFANIRNRNGDVVTPNRDSLTATIPNDLAPFNRGTHIAGSVANSPNKGAYPYAFFYYAVMPRNQTDNCEIRREALRFVSWRLINTQAQQLVQFAGFVPLPPKLVQTVLKFLEDRVYCNGKQQFGQSPCDRGCVGGECEVDLLFNAPTDICSCDVDHSNILKKDCSEDRAAEFIAFENPIGSAFTILSAVFILMTCLLIASIIYFRKLPLIKALSPIFCVMTLVGLLFEFIGIFVLVGQPSDSSCSLQMWFLSLPLAVIFAAIIVKQYRLVTVFENKARASIGIKNHQLLVLIFFIILPCIILLSIFTGVTEPTAMRKLNGAGEYVWSCEPKSPQAQTAVFALLGVFHFLQVAFSIFLAVKARNVRDEFNESSAIGLTVYILATVFVITIVILSIPQLPNDVRFIIRGIAVLFSSFAFAVILFLKPLQRIKNDVQERSRSKSTKATSGSKEGKSSNNGEKMKMVMKNGVMVAESQSASKQSDEDMDDADAPPVKRIKEDAYKWGVYARPMKFLERWRQCGLTFHKEMETVTLLQRSKMQQDGSNALSVAFQLRNLKLFYRGYNVTGGSQSSSMKIFKFLDADKTAQELENLVLIFKASNGEAYSVQMKSVKQAEQVVALITGQALKEDNLTSHRSTEEPKTKSANHKSTEDESQEDSKQASKHAESKHGESRHAASRHAVSSHGASSHGGESKSHGGESEGGSEDQSSSHN